MDEKKVLGLSTIAVIALILIAIGATYAFFKGTDASDTNTPLEVTTNTTDSLVFNVDTDISMVADMSNFTEGKGNREGVANATATLKANNKTNNATGNYYLYFDIKENELTYTTDDNTAELLLQVNGPDGVVTTIDGLNYVTVTDGLGEQVSGFDITEVKNLITIASNKSITTTSEKIDDWEIKVILVNLSTDQSSNGGKRFNGEILIQKFEQSINNLCLGKTFATCLKENYKLDSNLYYHKNLANSAEDGSYRYAGSYEDVENYVCFGSDEATCPHDNLYRIIGVFDNQVKLIKADYAKVGELGTNGDYKSTYKVSEGTNNWGTSKGSNTKSEIGGYYWNYNNGTSTNSNVWANSKLNKDNLNGTYLNSFSDSWQRMIAMHDWQVGGNTRENIEKQNPSIVYKNELLTPNTIETAKIGLMYVNDYGFAASPSYWTYTVGYNDERKNEYTNIEEDWLYSGFYEWTITRRLNDSESSFAVSTSAQIYGTNSYVYGFAVRPCFYLIPEVTLTSGSGAQNDPYRISIKEVIKYE